MILSEFQEKLIAEIQKAIDDYSEAMPAVEKQVYSRILTIVKDIEIKNGVIVNNYTNLRKIGLLQSEIQKAILSPKYLQRVEEFLKAFDAVVALQMQYFKTLDPSWTPGRVFKELQQQAKNAVIDQLTKSGLQAGLVAELEDLLRRNITTGGTFESLTFQLREYIVTQQGGTPGRLLNIANTLAFDALNQFSAQYMQIASSDLGFKWFMYTGSNKKTTREFCRLMTAKKYVYAEEIPGIVNGAVDGKKYAINPKTELWYGAIEGTNENNLTINRGGWRCGHQFTGVMEGVIPKEIRIATYNKYGVEHVNGKAVKKKAA